MTEWKLFDGDVPYVSTPEFHEHRDRAAHLEQAEHRGPLVTAARMIRDAAGPLATFSDLGCGDGGLLSLVQDAFPQGAWGYDFQPSNQGGWAQRGVTAHLMDAFGEDLAKVAYGSVVACTEVLEHLASPHAVVRRIYDDPATEALVCSSPWNEHAGFHDECHAWAWDVSGYAAMISNAGWRIWEHEQVGRFQVVRASRYPRAESL